MITIDVFHDTACPWCRIGKRHLQQALAEWTGEAVQVRYRTFFLNEEIPPQGYDFEPYMLAKGGHRIPVEQFFEGPRRMGAAVGLTFNFEKISKAPNTLLSHQLINLAPPEQREAMVDAIYAAYFEHGRDIGDLDTLVSVAAEQGLDASAVRQQLEAGHGREQALQDAQTARQYGISGVPFFVINNQYGLSGAQPPEVIKQVLAEVSGTTNDQ
jgi:predicted DsbA family dithiol-disulfide isomerase